MSILNSHNGVLGFWGFGVFSEARVVTVRKTTEPKRHTIDESVAPLNANRFTQVPC